MYDELRHKENRIVYLLLSIPEHLAFMSVMTAPIPLLTVAFRMGRKKREIKAYFFEDAPKEASILI